MMRPRKRRKTWLAILGGQDAWNASQMNGAVPTVSTKKRKIHGPQSHTGLARMENNFIHLLGDAGQTSML